MLTQQRKPLPPPPGGGSPLLAAWKEAEWEIMNTAALLAKRGDIEMRCVSLWSGCFPSRKVGSCRSKYLSCDPWQTSRQSMRS